MSRLGFDEACPKTPTFLTPQVADSTHSIFVSFACPKSDVFGRVPGEFDIVASFDRTDGKRLQVDFGKDETALVYLWQVVEKL
jgi:hypothetical protein